PASFATSAIVGRPPPRRERGFMLTRLCNEKNRHGAEIDQPLFILPPIARPTASPPAEGAICARNDSDFSDRHKKAYAARESTCSTGLASVLKFGSMTRIPGDGHGARKSEYPDDHLRPVARRRAFGGRTSSGADAE